MTDRVFREHLLPGEHIVWAGQPKQGLLFTSHDLILIPFSLFWCGFIIFWTWRTSAMSAPPVFLYTGMLFGVIGLYLLIGRFMVDAWVRRRTCYALTNHRILISRGGPFSKFTAISLTEPPVTKLFSRLDGRGTIQFGRTVPLGSGGEGFGFYDLSPSFYPTPQFLAIDDAKRVYDLVQEWSRKAARVSP